MNISLLFSSSPPAPLASPSPSPPMHQPPPVHGTPQELPSSPPPSSPPPSSNGGFPEDQAAEHDSGPEDSDTDETDEDAGDDVTADQPSSDGEDDGADLEDFVGMFSSSQPEDSDSEDSAHFTDSDGDNVHEDEDEDEDFDEQLLSETNPNGEWGLSADDSSSVSEGLSSTQGDAHDDSASSVAGNAPTADDFNDTEDAGDNFEGAYFGSDEELSALMDNIDPPAPQQPLVELDTNPIDGTLGAAEPIEHAEPAAQSSVGFGTDAQHNAALNAQLLLDLEAHNFSFYDLKRPTKKVRIDVPPPEVTAKVICEWIHDDTPGHITAGKGHHQLPDAAGPNKYHARALRIQGGAVMTQVLYRHFLMPAPTWQWAHTVPLNNCVHTPANCPGCVDGESIVVKTPR
ncbi:hypothetical protein OC842_006506 [Tilletia horrida]|uniref:Uncharacterized protein n=1 Tax=Tilletia horrida TaxID=155126 RepID=A0AAN6G7S0_9BASI|nr:hypothetical protein OC842_006506 [Tilletia horrida]